MRIVYKKKFAKTLNKCPQKIKNQVLEKIKLFQNDSNNRILNNHSLSGKLNNFRSININGDLRAIFVYCSNDDLVIFYFLGTHSELYR